ncbi:MAG: NUDIX domain-containing protein [Patescibacteria group bacterium]|nr:NUDIX domain-containing protein [Patescibacteria group bacterium]MDE1943902.1 NUDIX domain-containing protein [Patescibacteria group bacterium]MDE1945269.1 NUDIX domain-containing protein [Patescibacteria group bacterium]MDE2057413.1 NUDIX domain-containing protein [Patescibacteria group bacterium]
MTLQVGVKALLKNPEGKLLLLKRSAEKYGKTNGSWDIVGGRIDPGSALVENLAREIREETGLPLLGEPRLVAAQDILAPERHVVRLTYVARTEGEPVLDTSENSAYRWLTFAELAAEPDLDVFVKTLIESGSLTAESWD